MTRRRRRRLVCVLRNVRNKWGLNHLCINFFPTFLPNDINVYTYIYNPSHSISNKHFELCHAQLPSSEYYIYFYKRSLWIKSDRVRGGMERKKKKTAAAAAAVQQFRKYQLHILPGSSVARSAHSGFLYIFVCRGEKYKNQKRGTNFSIIETIKSRQLPIYLRF